MADSKKGKTAKASVKKQATPERSGPGVIVLQWLTYAFWGWGALALLWLVYMVLLSFMTERSPGDAALYAIAATLVLLPLSVACDVFYVRREPLKKAGASMVVMVFHAVIFAVLGIGALIAAVFSLIQLYVGSGDSTSTQVWLYSFLIAAAVYALLFMRALNPFSSQKPARLFPVAMVAIVGVFVVLGFVGPLAVERESRDDRRIEAHLSGVQHEINNYIYANKQLPKDLQVLNITDNGARQLVDDELVTYKQRGTVAKDNGASEYRYELCVSYVRASSTGYRSYSDGEYSEYLDSYNHPKGEACYSLKATTDAEAVQGVRAAQ